MSSERCAQAYSNTIFEFLIPQFSTVKFNGFIAIGNCLDTGNMNEIFVCTNQLKIGGMHITAKSK